MAEDGLGLAIRGKDAALTKLCQRFRNGILFANVQNLTAMIIEGALASIPPSPIFQTMSCVVDFRGKDAACMVRIYLKELGFIGGWHSLVGASLPRIVFGHVIILCSSSTIDRVRSMNHRFHFVDVFSAQSFSGNPLPVILNAEGLSSSEMQKITRWMNLSETAFVLPPTDPDADYRLRIFTLDREMPFAGHPTLGSCHAWLAAGGIPRSKTQIIQECGIGLVSIRRTDGNLAFAAPDLIRSGPVDAAKLVEICAALQIEEKDIVDAQWADNGPGWVVVLLESAAAVLAVKPLKYFPTRLDIGVVGPWNEGHDSAFELRALCTNHDGVIYEDPVTGSLNASVAQWLLASGRAETPYVASQGACIGRSGRIDISRDSDGTIWVGGCTRSMIEGDVVV